MSAFFIGIGLIFLGGLLSLFFPEKFKSSVYTVFTSTGSLVLAKIALGVLIGGRTISQTVHFPEPLGQANFVLDPLSAFFIIVIALGLILNAIYTAGYLKSYFGQNRSTGTHFFFLAMLGLAMSLVVVVQQALVFLIFWELMSLASFFLVVFENEKKEVLEAGLNYLIAMHIGFAFLLIGFLIIANQAGSYNFADFPKVFAAGKLSADLMFWFFFIGFGLKAGFIPLHTWLPQAHPAAPSHVSGLMSGVMIKTGIYGILRSLLFIDKLDPVIGYVVLIIAIVTAVYGITYAIAQRDLKRLLAYSSIENIGIIGLGLGVGLLGLAYDNALIAMLGFGGALLHVFNHALFKSLLFYGSGIVYLKTHTRDLEKLGGLIKKLPWTGFFMLFGSLAIAALPPFNGFVSELLIYFGLFQGIGLTRVFAPVLLILVIAGLALVGVLAMFCFTKAYGIAFLGQPRRENKIQPGEPWDLILPLAVCAVLSLMIGILPQFIFKFLYPVLSVLTGTANFLELRQTLSVFNMFSLVLGLLLGIFGALYIMKQVLLKDKVKASAPTWGCGYPNINGRVQYTGSSYINSFLQLVSPALKINTELKKPEGLFPGIAHFKSGIKDTFKYYIYQPLARVIQFLLNILNWVQTGDLQRYIVYGLVFLILALVWVVIF